MRNLILLTLLSCLHHLGFSQITIQIVDSVNNENIPFAHVLDETKSTIAVSNAKGVVSIDLSQIEKRDSKDPFNLFVKHISYNEKKLTIYPGIKTYKITLQENVKKLDPVIVTSKKQGQDLYIVLKGFFRSYQIENNVPKYYSDGFVEYYIPYQSGKKKLVSNNFLEHRTFQDYELVERDKTRKFNVKFDDFSPPFIYEVPLTLEVKENKKYEIVNINELTPNILSVVKIEEDTVGSYQYYKNSNTSIFSLDKYFFLRKNEKKFFGYHAIYDTELIFEEYVKSPGDLVSDGYDNLSRKIDYQKIYLKHKKDNKFKEIELTQEFYTTETRFISSSSFKKGDLTGYFTVQYSSKYEDDYLERIQSLKIPRLPGVVEKSLNNSLTQIDELICNTCK